MKRTYCDRCDKEIGNGESRVQRFTIFDNNKAVDLCQECYDNFCRWLRNEVEK